MKINGQTDIGQVRTENQDNFRSGQMSGGVAWGIVCDGMGGAQNGKQASATAVESIEDTLYQGLEDSMSDEEVEALLCGAVELANAEVYARSGEGSAVMGTTVVCALVIGNVLHLVHVGDSRAYLYDKGRLRQLTRDHSMVQELVDQGTLTDAEARLHPEKNVITRALGVEPDVQAEYQKQKLPKGAILLLCTDGLTNLVAAARIQQVMEQSDFYDLSTELVSDALLAGGTDNITVLVMQDEEGGK